MQITGLKIIDRTGVSLGVKNPYQTRTVSKITHIAVHHSASMSGTTATFEPTWASYGWTNGGYTFVILRDGTVEYNYPFTIVTNGVAGHNNYVLNVSVVGNASFTAEQEHSLTILLQYLMKELSVPVKNVWGHNEFSGNPTACPGRDMNELRTRIAKTAATTTASNAASSKTTTGAAAAGTHKVVSGDTLYALAQKYGVTVDAIQKANNLGTSTALTVGQTLVIPAGTTIAHTVASGETLYGIAGKYGVTVAAIQTANKLGTSTILSIGQILTIPGATIRTHTVVSGDTLYGIAGKYDVTVAAIQAANKLGTSTVLSIGQVLTIPN